MEVIKKIDPPTPQPSKELIFLWQFINILDNFEIETKGS